MSIGTANFLPGQQNQVQKGTSEPTQLIYCTRTVVEMEKTLNEIKNLLKKRELDDPTAKKFLAVGLTAKKNLCVHRDVDVWRA